MVNQQNLRGLQLWGWGGVTVKCDRVIHVLSGEGFLALILSPEESLCLQIVHSKVGKEGREHMSK